MTFSALFMAFSLFAHLALTTVRAPVVAGEWFCIESPTGAQTADRPEANPGHADAAFDHCSDCAIATSPTLPGKEPFHCAPLFEGRLVFFQPNWIDPFKPRGAGEKRSRAPPVAS